jgi:hypothetical protein
LGNKKRKKPDASIHSVFVDWKGREILLTHSVFSGHLVDAAHDEAYLYYETLKENLSKPETVVKSRYRRDTLIANIKLHNREDNYLRVVIRYGTIWGRLLGARNYIASFYGADSPKLGENICIK